MLKQILYGFWLSFSDIFNLKDEEAKGRTIVLTSSILTTIYNVFITGIFYTGFLTMYGMSITDTGIITFIPYIANMFSIFTILFPPIYLGIKCLISEFLHNGLCLSCSYFTKIFLLWKAYGRY